MWFVFQTPDEEKAADQPIAAATDEKPVVADEKPVVVEAGERFTIKNVKTVPDSTGSLVEFTVSGNLEKPLELTSPTVRLLTDAGDEIDRFFLPFDSTPILEGEAATADLKYWVRGEMAKSLWLEIDGERVAVDLEKR